MSRLLIFELKKLSKTLSFYICLGISALLALMTCLTSKMLADMGQGSCVAEDLIISALSNGFAPLLTAIFTSLFISADQHLGTLKNIYAKGYSRIQVFFSKYLVSLLAAIAIGAADIIVCTIAGIIIWGAPSLSLTYSLVMQIMALIGFHAIAVAVATALTHTGACIAVNIVIPTFLDLVLSLVDLLTSLFLAWEFKFNSYWLSGFLSSAGNYVISTSTLWTAVLGSLAYTAVAIVVGVLISRKKQL